MKRALIVLGVLVLLGGIVFFSVQANGRDKGVRVYVQPVERRAISQVVKASGAIDPRVKVNISAHVIGKIEKLYVEEGDAIRKGQPFLTLEREAFLAENDRWVAQLRRSETEVRQAEVSLADARHKLERARRLNAEGISSSEALENAVLQEASAKLHLDDAQEAVRQTRANLDKAKDDLAKTTLYAPISGRVVDLNAEEGEVVVSGTMNNPASVIGVIADLSEILANVDVDETEIVNVKPGQKATLEVDAVPGRTYHGKVVKLGSSGFNRPQQQEVTFFDVEVLLEDADEALRPGMSVRAEIETDTKAGTLVAPIQSVVERTVGGKDAKVVFVDLDGKAVQRKVETGLSDETHVELLSGVKAGEKVVTGPYRTLKDLKDGGAVRVSHSSEKEDRDREERESRKEEEP